MNQTTPDLIGATLDRARILALPWTVRVVKLDGVDRMVSADVRDDRLNVEVERGVVTKVVGVY